MSSETKSTKQRIDDLLDCKAYLTAWEHNFLVSVRAQVTQRTLSDKQFQVISDIETKLADRMAD